MIRIAICDDDQEELNRAKVFLDVYLIRNKLTEVEISTFRKPSALLEAMKKFSFQVYLLDIVMPAVSGIDIGRKVRQTDDRAILIYMTTSREFALDAYGVHASRYLLKPLKESEAMDAFSYVFNSGLLKPSERIPVKTKNGFVNIDEDTILYIENRARIMRFRLIGGPVVESVSIRGSFEEQVESLLQQDRFFHCHKSFVINFDFVQNFANNSFVMENGEIVQISRSKLAEAKSRYLDYMAERM